MCEPVHDYKTDEEDMTPVNLPRKSDVQRQFEHTMEVHGFVEKSKGTNVPVPDEQKPKLEINWSEVPSDFKWAAINADGRVWIYTDKPEKGLRGFVLFNLRSVALLVETGPYSPNWRDTLTERPEEPTVEQPEQPTAKPHKHAALIAEAVQDMTKQIYLKTPQGWIESQLEYVVDDHAGEEQFSFAPLVKPEVTSPLTDDELDEIWKSRFTLDTARRAIANAAHKAALKEVAAMPSKTTLPERNLIEMYVHNEWPRGTFVDLANAAIAEFQAQLLKQLGE